MGLPRPVIWLLIIVWLTCFVYFVVVSLAAFGSGVTHEYELYGFQFPYIAAALLGCMSTASGLLWANYRGEAFSGAEELVYGALFFVSLIGLVLSGLLVLFLVVFN